MLSSRSNVVLGLVLAAAVGVGCYTGSAVDTNGWPGGPTTDTNATDPALTPGSNIHGLTHLPCEVETLLAKSCWDCHGTVPGFGATTTLVTYDDLMKAVPAIQGYTEADICILRMNANKNPMPPDKKLDDASIAVLQKWLDDGKQAGHCGEVDDAGAGAPGAAVTDDAGAPLAGPAVCATGNVVSPASTAAHQTALTDPGTPCLSCHSGPATTGAASKLTVGGTVFKSAAEPNGCVGVTGASVIVIDAKGEAHTLPTNAVGNFSAPSSEQIPFPYRALVVEGTKIREMKTAQTNGDCNACHEGPSRSTPRDAPGRILAP